jgi:hypothetical protein
MRFIALIGLLAAVTMAAPAPIPGPAGKEPLYLSFSSLEAFPITTLRTDMVVTVHGDVDLISEALYGGGGWPDV